MEKYHKPTNPKQPTAIKLIITEKPSTARSIASVLRANKRGDGFLEGNGYIVSWCFGHLLELAPPDAYDKHFKRWRYADLPIVPQKWKHIPTKDKAAQLTAEWEHKLKQVERGELDSKVFMDGIAAFTTAIVAENNVPNPEIRGR